VLVLAPASNRQRQVSAIAQGLCASVALATYFATIYLAYLWMYLAPTDGLRRGGAATWYRLFASGPAWERAATWSGGAAELPACSLAPVRLVPASAPGGQPEPSEPPPGRPAIAA